MNSFNFAILGGDNRYRILYEMLLAEGCKVKIYRNKYMESTSETIDSLLNESDILILPIPVSRDSENIFLDDEIKDKIKIKALIEKCACSNIKYVFGGVIGNDIMQIGKERGINFIDFFEQESVAVLNAIPTAEGAVSCAIEESDRTLFASNALVLGYGRCGKILSRMLKGIGANVSVTYRNDKDCAYIKALGYNGIHLNILKDSVKSFDFIFNTIPASVLNKEILDCINKKCTIIDIAQAPGGVDYNYARSLDIKAIYCPGLPGRVAPFTASEILKNTVFDTLKTLS